MLGARTAAADEPPLAPPSAPVARVPVGFSNLVMRIQGDDEIGIVKDDHRVQLLERMRERGFNAVGAENLVFEKDESHRAAFRLGGTVRELTCRQASNGLRCVVGVEWQLLDVARDAVVYSVLARHAVLGVPQAETKRMPARLLLGTLDSLLGRDGFRAALALAPAATPADPSFAPAAFGRCAALGKKMPAVADRVLDGTALIRAKDGFGSGFFLSSDGLVLTAAHVVDAPTVKLRLHNGMEFDAVPVRIARGLDVALLRPARPLTNQPCLPVAASTPAVGSEVYAAGAPADEKLAFSLTRGIVSGVRLLDGRQRLQTDAAVSPGNSGGPLVDAGGEVLAVVTSKLVGKTVEGIAFSAPIAEVLKGLGLTSGAATDPALLSASSAVVERPAAPPVVADRPDPMPELNPEAVQAREREKKALHERAVEAEREEQRRKDADAAAAWQRAERARLTPSYVPVMLWGGVAAATVGVAMAAFSYADYDRDTSTRRGFRAHNAVNLAGWGLVGVGATSALVSFALRPAAPPWPGGKGKTSLAVGPGGVSLGGEF